MTRTTALAATPVGAEDDLDFELDVSIVESGSVADLMLSTSDNCGSTCESACTSCQS